MVSLSAHNPSIGSDGLSLNPITVHLAISSLPKKLPWTSLDASSPIFAVPFSLPYLAITNSGATKPDWIVVAAGLHVCKERACVVVWFVYVVVWYVCVVVGFVCVAGVFVCIVVVFVCIVGRFVCVCQLHVGQ